MNDKDRVTNISTALMALMELATACHTPINIHFAEHRIYVCVGFGTPHRKEMAFYPQDTYRDHSKTDAIYKWIDVAVEKIYAIKKDIPISDEVMTEARRRVFEEMKGARRFPDPWPNTTEDTHPFLAKNLILPASELRDGFLSGISADPNTEVIDAINGLEKAIDPAKRINETTDTSWPNVKG